MKELKNREKGVTMVALVVTIIVLLILSAVAMSLIVGENGLFTRAGKSRDEYESATRKEQEFLENLYSSIKIADNDDAEITINMKELKNIIEETVKQKVEEEVEQKMSEIAQGVNTNSVIMKSRNADKNLGEKKLNSFENTFKTGEFEKYFEYDGTTGELICKQDGWFLIYIRIRLGDTSKTWANSTGGCFVNGVEVISLNISAGEGSNTQVDSCSTSIYLKKGDKLTINKTVNNVVTTTNVEDVVILKI